MHENAKEDQSMKYPWIDEYLMAKRGVTKDLQEEWNWIRYHIGGKMFASVLLDDSNQPYYINLKLEPMEGELMRQQYPDIIPGYYSNKQHWNSVKPDGEIPDDLLKHWLDRSYELVLNGLSEAEAAGDTGTVCLRNGLFRLSASRQCVHRMQRSLRKSVSCCRESLSDLCLLRQ